MAGLGETIQDKVLKQIQEKENHMPSEATYTIQSISPYSSSAYFEPDQQEGESSEQYEKRNALRRCHYDSDGYIYIPGMAFKYALTSAAKYQRIKKENSGQETMTKHLEAGLLVTSNIDLGIKADDLEFEWFFVPSDGKRGGAKRIKKCFPSVKSWHGQLNVGVLDDNVTEEILTECVKRVGMFIGVGRFRPEKGGFYGRFQINDVKWSKV